MPVLGRLGLVIAAVALLVLLDLSTKGWATGTLRPAGGRTVAGGQVRLQYHENPGIAFGLLRDAGGAGSAGADRRQRGIVAYAAVASVVLTGLLLWLTLRERGRRRGGAAVVALASGGLAALLAFALVIYYLYKTDAHHVRMQVALGLVGGGAIGNLIDRILHGRVTDFIVWHYKHHEWPAFNIADAALVVGVGLMAIDMLRAPKPAAAAAPQEKDR